jgi:phytoene dehydrogenase-like protein
VTTALAAAARGAGVEIRTAARVLQILVKDETASGVVLDNGEEIRATRILSTTDPRRTLLTLVDPVHLPPEPARRIRNIRMRGTMAKINYAVSALPAFAGMESSNDATRRARLGGVVRLAEGLDGLSGMPAIRRTPGALDRAVLRRSPFDTRRRRTRRLRLRAIRPLTSPRLNLGVRRDRFADVATATIRPRAGICQSVLARVITPLDLQETYGLTGGHIFHGEIALDQLLVGRPTLGWGRHQTPIGGLFLGGAGTHPGAGLDGRSGWQAAKAVLRAIGK